jgi:hypothetical protein
MANKQEILDKIARNLKQRGIPAASVVRGATTVSVTKTGGDVLVVSYVDKSVQSPMGGVNPATSPFLGIGVAAPGSIKIKGAAAEATIAAIFDTAEALQLLNECASYANDIIVEAGNSTIELVRMRGIADAIGMGS